MSAPDSLVSVILPTRSRSKLLSRAVQSVLTQTHAEFELIIIDDASNDNTADVVAQFKDTRIQYIRHETARGPGASRNAGIAAAQGDFVAFLDDDDEFLPDKLQTQMDAFRKAMTGVGVIIGDVEVRRNGSVVTAVPYDGAEGNIFLHVLAGNMIPLNGLLLRRSVVADFDEKLPCLEDFDFCLRCVQHTKAVYVDKPCAVFHADTNRKRLMGERINLHRSFKILRNRWFNDPEDIFLKRAEVDLVLNFALRLLATGVADEPTRGYVNEAFRLKKDRRRAWYRMLNALGPGMLKFFAVRAR